MRIVTVTALNEANVHTMPIRPRKFSAFTRVASITKGWLRCSKQEAWLRCVMRRVAVEAAHSVRRMSRSAVIGIFEIVLMTPETALSHLRSTQLRKSNDRGLIACALHVR
jgi:hypothetical protein